MRVGNSNSLSIWCYGDYVIVWSYRGCVICCGIGDLAKSGGVVSAVVVAGFGLIGLIVRGVRVRPLVTCRGGGA